MQDLYVEPGNMIRNRHDPCTVFRHCSLDTDPHASASDHTARPILHSTPPSPSAIKRKQESDGQQACKELNNKPEIPCKPLQDRRGRFATHCS